MCLAASTPASWYHLRMTSGLRQRPNIGQGTHSTSSSSVQGTYWVAGGARAPLQHRLHRVFPRRGHRRVLRRRAPRRRGRSVPQSRAEAGPAAKARRRHGTAFRGSNPKRTASSTTPAERTKTRVRGSTSGSGSGGPCAAADVRPRGGGIASARQSGGANERAAQAIARSIRSATLCAVRCVRGRAPSRPAARPSAARRASPRLRPAAPTCAPPRHRPDTPSAESNLSAPNRRLPPAQATAPQQLSRREGARAGPAPGSAASTQRTSSAPGRGGPRGGTSPCTSSSGRCGCSSPCSSAARLRTRAERAPSGPTGSPGGRRMSRGRGTRGPGPRRGRRSRGRAGGRRRRLPRSAPGGAEGGG